MNEIQYAERALDDIERLADFLPSHDSGAAVTSVGIIFDALGTLAHSPEIGRKARAGNRELMISRGASGYLALYRFLPRCAAGLGVGGVAST